jgi:hypothetical protein
MALVMVSGVGRWCAGIGSRQSESTKILTEPPAVRTYSSFPLASQL